MSKVKEDTAKVDNTAVVKPKVFERLRVTPRKYELVDLGGTPSNDTRTPAERNKDYLHPIKGAKERFKASMSNETNPLVGIERTILPSAAGAALVTTPIALAKGAGYGFGIDKLTGGWGNMVERTTGIPSEIAQYTNPGAIIGGAAGYRLDQKNLLSKFIKGDADLAWNPINKNHWIFNKEARTASNIGMAVTNRLAPFLQGVEKLPLKVAAYKTAKRTKGNASVTLSEIKGNPSDYAGASILGGGNLEGRNLVAQYIFGENPIIKRVFFNKATSNIKPISNNEAKRGFSHGDRYEQLYPGIYNRRYEMRSVVPQGRPLKFSSSEFAEYAGNNPVGKVIGKEGDMIMRTGDTEFMVFRNPGTNYVGPIDDVGGHVIKLQMDKGKLKQTSQDMWKFNPADYAKRWNESPNAPDQVRLTKQAALMDKVGTPFILQQSNPIWIEGRSVRQAMKVGGKFTFKKSPAVKDAEKLNGKRDMRKKFVKSSRPTYKRRIRKGQVGMRFVSYVPVNNPTIDYTDITNPINPFSEYYIPTTYNTEQALVVPEREDSKSDTVEETPAVASKPIAEPVVNKPVASKVVVDTANSTWSSPYKDRSKWVADLTNAYKRAGITNDNAIRMLVSQDALESAWGRSAQGKFNFGNLTTGAKWQGDYVTGNDKNAKGEAIKQKFRSYNSMDEYAADKVQFLKRLYDFDENDDINKFVAKLTGSNKGKRRYAEARNYADTLKKVYNSYRSGGIIKYQNPAQPIKYMGGYDKRGNMVLPVTNENGMNNVTLPEVTVTPRNINLAGAVDKGKRNFLNTSKELATPVAMGAGITGLGYGLATAAIPTLLSAGAGYVGGKVGKRIDNKVNNNSNYKAFGELLGGLVGGVGAVATPKLIAGDAYTTVGGKFGYYGNPIKRVWHTVGRNHNWNVSAKHPELMRKLEEPIKVNPNGILQVTNPNPRFSKIITNFTTDRPVVSHAGGNWDGRDLYIFNPKIVKGKKPASIEPSDTFYPNVNITAKPSQTTLVSGNPLRLADAKSKGMSTLSSPEARRLYQEAQWKYLGDLKKWKSNKDAGGNFKIKFDDYADDYAKEIQRLQSKRGTPTVYDYAKLERSTGLDAGVISIDEMNPQIVDYYMYAGAEVPYPNGRVIDSDYFYPQTNSEKNVLNRAPYNKVFYDPATAAEWDYKELHGIK